MRLMWICWCEGKPSGNQNKILPKFGHFHFAQSCLKICHFLDFSPTFEIKYRMLAKYLRFDVYLLFQVSLAVTNEVHTQLGAAIRVLVVLELKKGTHLLSSLPPKVTRYLSEGEKARASTFTLWRVKVVWAFLAAKSQTITSAVKPMCVNWKSGALGKLGTLKNTDSLAKVSVWNNDQLFLYLSRSNIFATFTDCQTRHIVSVSWQKLLFISFQILNDHGAAERVDEVFLVGMNQQPVRNTTWREKACHAISYKLVSFLLILDTVCNYNM